MHCRLVFANPNPNATEAEEILQDAVLDAQRMGLDVMRAVSVVMTLIRAGKEIARGGTGIDSLDAALAIIENEIAEGRATAVQAKRVVDAIGAIRSLMSEVAMNLYGA